MKNIKKTQVPKEIRRKIAEIKSTQEWRAIKDGNTIAIRAQFDKLPKEDIREALLQEQHCLCAYCMKQIKNEALHMGIEHWVPLSADKEKALDYNNLLGVCKGGADVLSLENGKRILCCDASKGDEYQMVINPLDPSMMEQIAYRKDGTIYFQNSDKWSPETINNIIRDINETLCLNGKMDNSGKIIADTATCLVKGRRDACRKAEEIIKHLSKKKTFSSKDLKKVIRKRQNEDKSLEFNEVCIFFLNRKLKSMNNQKR